MLRVLGNVLHLHGFDDESSESVRDSALSGGVPAHLSNRIQSAAGVSSGEAPDLQRVADVPIYRTDPLVRRAVALQQTAASAAPVARLSAHTLARLGIAAGQRVRVKSATGSVELTAEQDNTLATGAVRVPAGFEQTIALGSAFGQLIVERA